MAQVYLGNTALNQTWLGNTRINTQIKGSPFVGILDEYPGSLAAYSLRRLSGEYNGPLIRVRRSSDNALLNVGWDSNYYLDTASIESWRGGSTDVFVDTWYDQSGNSYNLTQNNTSVQPRIYNNGYPLINDKLSIEFTTGVNPYFTTNFNQSINQPLTWFDLGYFLFSSATMHDNITSSDRLYLARSTQFIIGDGSTNINIDTTGASGGGPTDGQILFSELFNTNNSLLRGDFTGTNTAYTSSVNTGTLSSKNIEGISMGREPDLSGGLRGNYQESIVWASNLSSSIQNIVTEINSFYNTFTP